MPGRHVQHPRNGAHNGPVRAAAVAGSWYPSDAATLERDVDRYLAAAAVPEHPAPQAIVTPHAGLIYSGPVAAYAYKAIAARDYAAVVLVGPSHFVGFPGVSLWPSGAWVTPFGEMPVAQALASAIAGETREVVEYAGAHRREHSLEMQLPFLARLMPGIGIVPLVMGYQDRRTAEALGDAIAAGVRRWQQEHGSHPPVLLVASSDLSHYHDAATAEHMDTVVLDCVGALDPDALMTALEREPHHACGGGPMVAVLRAARLLGARESRVLRYADSGDVSGDKSSVVGYMAASLW